MDNPTNEARAIIQEIYDWTQHKNTPWAKRAKEFLDNAQLADEDEKYRAEGEKAIWDAVQELSPWTESNDMEWADEILCGLAGVKQRVEEAEGNISRLDNNEI